MDIKLVRTLADAVAVLHFVFIIFVMVGGLIALKWPHAMWIHLPAALWGAWIEFAGGICPLTPLENWLRERGGERGYGTGFIAHYVLPLIYPGEMTETVRIALGFAVVGINVGIYAWVWRRKNWHR